VASGVLHRHRRHLARANTGRRCTDRSLHHSADGRSRRGAPEAQRQRLEVGRDIPANSDIAAIVKAAQGRWRPILITAILTSLRASELRDLRWWDVDLASASLHVPQRADRYGEIGKPKSRAGWRTVPLPPICCNSLRQWKLVCPKRDAGKVDADGNAIKELHLVFPNGAGKIESLANIINRGLIPTQIAVGVATDTGKRDERASQSQPPTVRACTRCVTGMRSWLINRRQDGGLELPPKLVQERLGHATIAVTMDTYGHLFPRGDDAEELAAAEKTLLA
jgi:integrase